MTQTYSRKVTHSQVKTKQHSLRRRVNARAEAKVLLRIKNRLERRIARQLDALFTKFVRTHLFLFKRYGIYEWEQASRNLSEDFIPMLIEHYRRVYLTIFTYNESKYLQKKQEEAFVFGRSRDFETMIDEYFGGRALILAGITDRLARRIDIEIRKGRAEGLTLSQIATAVSTKFAFLTKYRANMIARTETHNAAGFANHAYHQALRDEAGLDMVKKWVSVADERTRSAHVEANGQVVEMDEDFTIGGAPMKHVGDPRGGLKNIINCRCVIVYQDRQDIDD